MAQYEIVHELKIHRQPFEDLLSGAKTCEVRRCDDRNFSVGDLVWLRELRDGFGSPWSGRELRKRITHIQKDYGLPDHLCILSYAPAEDACPPLIKTLRDNGELIALKATVAQQAKMIEALQAEEVRAVWDEPVAFELLFNGEQVDVVGKHGFPPASLETYHRNGYESGRLYRHLQRPVVLPERLQEILQFLLGVGELDGLAFGEHRALAEKYWWRKELRACLDEIARLNP